MAAVCVRTASLCGTGSGMLVDIARLPSGFLADLNATDGIYISYILTSWSRAASRRTTVTSMNLFMSS